MTQAVLKKALNFANEIETADQNEREYITQVTLNEEQKVIGYRSVNLGRMMSDFQRGIDPDKAIKSATQVYDCNNKTAFQFK